MKLAEAIVFLLADSGHGTKTEQTFVKSDGRIRLMI
jgi:hypothetical protein